MLRWSWILLTPRRCTKHNNAKFSSWHQQLFCMWYSTQKQLIQQNELIEFLKLAHVQSPDYWPTVRAAINHLTVGMHGGSFPYNLLCILLVRAQQDIVASSKLYVVWSGTVPPNPLHADGITTCLWGALPIIFHIWCILGFRSDVYGACYMCLCDVWS